MLPHRLVVPTLPADLKYANRSQVIYSFLNHGTLSANDIAAEIGLSRQTVMKSVQFFLNSGLLVSEGKGASTSVGGKRPELFALSPHKYFLCLTLWPMELRVNLYTIGGKRVDQIALRTSLPDDAKDAIHNVGSLAQQLLAKNQIPPEDLCAVSLSTAGTVDYQNKRLKYSSQSPAWGTNIPIGEYLAPYFAPGTPIFLENAGKMTARPFLLEQELTGKRVLVIFACWGLSSCLIEKDHILSGKNSLIGEIGHMVIDPNDPERCGCGSNGCLERLVSIKRLQCLIDKKRDAYPTSPLLKLKREEITIPRILAAAEVSDPLGTELCRYLASTFAGALRNIALVFDPDLIVFQGDYADAGSCFDRELRSCLKNFQYFPSEGPFDIRYDQRPLEEMDAIGSYISLVQCYFNMPERYLDSSLVPETGTV